MKRLTFLDAFNEPCYRINGTVYKNEISSLLAAYEDTDMTPEEIIRMAKEVETRFLIYMEREYGDGTGAIIDLLSTYKKNTLIQQPENKNKMSPARSGYWKKEIEDGMYWYACSECGEEVPKTRYKTDLFSAYCPHCGASMTIRNEDQNEE